MHVRDIMTRTVVSVRVTDPVTSAAEKLTHRGFSALPVVDESGMLVGIVTEADLIRNRFAGSEAGVTETPGRTVAEVMTAPVDGVSHDADVTVVAKVMLEGHRRCVPVVDGTRLVGVVTRRDVVRILARADNEIATTVRTRLQVLGGQARWTVRVTDGDVVVHDQFDEASDREVAKVLAESVPGVIRAVVLPPVRVAADPVTH